MKKLRVAFDFDSTLDNPIVQEYAKSLVEKGIEVWIVTSRMDNQSARNYLWNRDLFLVAKSVGILECNINFCNMEDKYKFFQRNEGFLWHLDDDMFELDLINDETITTGVYVYNNNNWLKLCEDLLNEKITTLYRPVGPEEMDIIKKMNYIGFLPRLLEQPIFYPVMNKEYAIQISKDWNVPAYGQGFVLKFVVNSDFLKKYKVQNVGGKDHNELWIPAEDLDELNKNIIGKIEVVETFYK